MSRLLRGYRHIANTEYYCEVCRHVISPGEEYEGLVFVHEKLKKNRIGVRREHISCPLDYLIEEEKELGICDGEKFEEEEAEAA